MSKETLITYPQICLERLHNIWSAPEWCCLTLIRIRGLVWIYSRANKSRASPSRITSYLCKFQGLDTYSTTVFLKSLCSAINTLHMEDIININNILCRYNCIWVCFKLFYSSIPLLSLHTEWARGIFEIHFCFSDMFMAVFSTQWSY